MTRIIAGAAGGLRLRTPSGSDTRPTSDRVREALFSALDARGVVEDARVLDLYAGSGALGFEAASRGAASVDLVEQARGAVTVLRANAEALSGAGVAAAVRVHQSSVNAWLGRGEGGPFDLVFADPPYALAEAELADVLAQLGDRLAPDGVLVVERSARSPEPAWPSSVHCLTHKKYGETAIWTAIR